MSIQPLPTPPSRDDPTNFAARADAFLAALTVFGAELNLLATDMNAKKGSFDSDFALAMASGLASAATNSATAATKAAQALQAAADAATAKDAALGAWSAALAANPDLDPIARMNPSVVASDFSVPTGYNAYSAGPLEIKDGVAVTLNDFSEWSVL